MTAALYPNVAPVELLPGVAAGELGAPVSEVVPSAELAAPPLVVVAAAAFEVETPEGTTPPGHVLGGGAVLP
jgi:hypothetical protein